jgi:hypothetical protein
MTNPILKVAAVLILSLVINTSCGKKEVTVINGSMHGPCETDDEEGCVYEYDYIGTWNWGQSSNYSTGETVSQYHVDYTIRLEISETTIKRYVNDELESELDYTGASEMTLEGYKTDVITIEGNPISIGISGKDDEMLMIEQSEVGSIHQYFRAP